MVQGYLGSNQQPIRPQRDKARSLPNAKLIFTQTVNLPPGSNYLYLGVWDMTTGRTGTVNAAVDVKKPTG